MHIICPHCRNPIELIDASSPEGVCCPSCGASFRLEQESTVAWAPLEHQKLGRFELLEAVGMGAFGTVYRAWDPELERMVAIKVPRSSNLPDAQDLDRFLHEARSVAQLRHPSIVSVHEVGQSDNVPYLVSDFIEGLTLADLLSARQPTPRESARILAGLADALAYAHEHGIIHRDIKPSNIMLETADPSVSRAEMTLLLDGTPRLMDFGLAKRDAAEITMTLDGQVLGTPAYMSPEQACGDSHNVDCRTDLYSLGVILYQMLTGELPFRGTTRMLLHQVMHDDPRPPRKLNDHIPRDLETICLKAMAKDPSRRYQTAKELADDLQRFLNGEPIKARPVGKTERFLRWCRRNPRVAALTSIVAALLLLIAAGATVAAALLDKERGRISSVNNQLVEEYGKTKAERERAEGAEHERTEQLFNSLFREAQAGRWSGRAGRRFDSLRALKDAAKIACVLQLPPDRIVELRNEAIASMALVDLQISREWTIKPPWKRVAAFDAKYEHYALDDGVGLVGEGHISIRRVADDDEMVALPGFGSVAAHTQFSPNGQFLAVKYQRGDDINVYVWDLKQRKALLKLPNGTHGMAFSPDSRLLAVGQRDAVIVLYDVASGKQVMSFQNSVVPYHIHFHPNGRKLAASANNATGTVHVWDLDGGKVVKTFTRARRVFEISWHPHGKLLAVACADFRVYVWNVETDRIQAVLEGHEAEVIHLGFSRDGAILISSSWDGTTRLWEPMSGKRLVTTTPASYFMFARDDARLAFGAGYWELAPGRECRTLHSHFEEGKGPWSADFSPDTLLLASASDDGVRVWDVAARRELVLLPVGTSRSALFHPTDGSLITFGKGTGLCRWPVKRVKRDPTAHRIVEIGPPQSLGVRGDRLPERACLSRDGRLLGVAADRNTGEVVLLDLEKNTKRVLEPRHAGVASIAISPDSKWLATGAWLAQGVKIWNTETGALVKELLPESLNTPVAFSADGKWLMTWTKGEYGFWEVGTWRPAHRIAIPGSGAHTASFSSDGKMLALLAGPSQLRLLDAAPGREFATFPTYGPLCFSRDGTLLATSGGLHVIQVWDLRLIREQLADMGLDWDLRPYPPAATVAGAKPLQVKVDLGIFAAEDAYKLAGEHARQLKLSEAEQAYRQVIEIVERTLAQSPENASAQDLAGKACNQLGILLKRQNRDEEAKQVYLKGLVHREALVKDNPQDARHLSDLGAILNNLGFVLRDEGEPEQAYALFKRAIEVQSAARKIDPQNATHRAFLRNHYFGLATTSILRDDHAQAAKAAGELPKLNDTGSEFFQAARILAQCVPLVEQASELKKERQAELMKSYADQAVQLLRQAKQKGHPLQAAATDSAFDALRSRADFKELLRPQ